MSPARSPNAVPVPIRKGARIHLVDDGGLPPRAVVHVNAHFPAAAVRTSTIRRWKIRTMITSGTVTITPAAICSPKGRLEFSCPGELGDATVAVWIFGSLIIERSRNMSRMVYGRRKRYQ